MSPGYSKTPLNKKLGIKTECRLYLKNAPAEYLEWIAPLPEPVDILKRLSKNIDIIHFYTKSRKELETLLPKYMSKIQQNGMIWVSWPKKASKVPKDITEGTIRDVCLPLGLVDVKVCAVSEVWSGLKLVIRKELRK